MLKQKQNLFEKFWFSDVMDKFIQNNFIINYDYNTFKAVDRYDETIRYTIEITQTKILVTIPLEKNYEYKTFTEYFKVYNYLLYHLNDTTPLINTYEFIDSRDVKTGLKYY